MKTSLMIAAVVAILAAPVLANAADASKTAAKPAAAKQTYCQDPKTHKRISCKTTAATKPAPAKPAMAMAAAKPTAAKQTYCQDPKTHKRISCKTPPAAAAPMAAKPASPMMASKPAHTAAAKGKGVKCGNSYIAAGKTCHK